jgi:hypothetical protein
LTGWVSIRAANNLDGKFRMRNTTRNLKQRTRLQKIGKKLAQQAKQKKRDARALKKKG